MAQEALPIHLPLLQSKLLVYVNLMLQIFVLCQFLSK